MIVLEAEGEPVSCSLPGASPRRRGSFWGGVSRLFFRCPPKRRAGLHVIPSPGQTCSFPVRDGLSSCPLFLPRRCTLLTPPHILTNGTGNDLVLAPRPCKVWIVLARVKSEREGGGRAGRREGRGEGEGEEMGGGRREGWGGERDRLPWEPCPAP